MLGLAAGPAMAASHNNLQAVNGKGADNCPYKAAASRDENRAQARELASRLIQPGRPQSRQQQNSRTIRN